MIDIKCKEAVRNDETTGTAQHLLPAD